ncbi:similar to Saccharomyces cerevisiae YKL055C OAR1 Mitochondrial 3-oxoacyl-[acyl-carrier-protein] reductase, may comprise a type II mitochondrial fatty acid synthase along with Mct1p [Maudiozyma saulgeensis]|uniref:Similar to Saccharomyces cerevisiae YKL055C OAR1 Mitochondrial 3-oxoacyl-[acyl-carrier-protein] reductase, may comprise a type II mitochondrial fatty acid synthase along with Mct1p n=1 Tax=Maudiozyma saulgeensis TaxID=1789683 RepID=A0A1X7QWQ6_9SACH|nr:similar to Saccharomyces cerevisiae YKL055C OAR1 Mitochondrial 3-oxoacyl-[acyl-carrier-protein] reductase, may comprise a type II mitochondrial fatty acid synthase along with Mct1p [Kazachstania saulgeensis]
MNHIPVAVVTGATRGIGKAIASRLSKEGMSCILIGSTKQSIAQIKVQEHLHFVNPYQKHRALAIDLSQWPQWTLNSKGIYSGIDFQGDTSDKIIPGQYRLFPKVNQQLWETPRTQYYISLLVNCAGISQHSLSVRTPTEQIARIMNLNFASCVSLSNLSIKHMMKTVRQDLSSKHCIPGYVPPCIINISSILGEPKMTIPGTTIYSASKAALTQYTRALTQEITTWGIRAESISPGLVTGTDMTNEMDPIAKAQLVDSLIGLPTHTPNEIATEVWKIYSGNNSL